MKLTFGTQSQVRFANPHEYYYALGFLANTKNAELKWEHNEDQGAWGSEGRIHCLVPENQFPQNFKFTAGRGNVYARINCNDYVETLIKEHNYRYNTRGQDVEEIVSSVPDSYMDDFVSGYGESIRSVAKINATTENSIKVSQGLLKAIPKSKEDYMAPNVKTGSRVISKGFGSGVVISNDSGIMRVRFRIGEKSFQFPNAFRHGFLKLEEK